MKSLIIFVTVSFLLLLVTVRVKAQAKLEDSDEFGEKEIEANGFNNGTNYKKESALMSLRGKNDGTTACIKECDNATQCYCKVLAPSKKPHNVFSTVQRFCTNGQCNYCVNYGKRCGFGSKGPKPENGYLPCCAAEGIDKDKAEYRGKDVDCFYSDNQKFKRYICVEPCNTNRSIRCNDKDGYRSLGDYVDCQGNRKFTHIKCIDNKPTECGAPGATCGKGDPCCPAFNCTDGKCVRKCADDKAKCDGKDESGICCRGNCIYGTCDKH